MCLYYPGEGYYTSPKEKIGKNGDFYTSANVSGLFGAMIGRQLEEMWNLTGGKEFIVVEYGAGTGMLCHDILDYLKGNRKFYSRLTYCIIEKSPVMREKEKSLLQEKVCWCNSIHELPAFTGCVLSNEVVDNFSVHRVMMRDVLMEIFVDYKEEGFTEVMKPATKELATYFAELNVVLPEDFCTEINLEAIEWIKEIGNCLKKGYVLTIDYGFPSSKLYHPRRCNGTLLCYHKHTLNDQLYKNIGEQDITSHINFSALSHWGYKNDLIPVGFTSQASFLVNLGWQDYLNKTLLQHGDNYQKLRQYSFLKYTLLLDMGQKFNVFIQGKSIPGTKLKGVKDNIAVL
ncbi:MAG TPA: SAM-dependent methyltransferase [Chitinophagaceae bacterium]|nr:SAM-dependent methyltransferase [Chitinophagaceae bacterium]